MKISIALCTYNGEMFLRDQLASVASQTILPDEVVACDDCSQDKTVELLREFSQASPFPVHIHINEKNLQSTKNFERAIGLCRGDLIFCADQDDVWYPHKIEESLKLFQRNERLGMVFGNAEVVDENMEYLGYDLWDHIKFDKSERRAVRSGEAFRVLLRHNVVTGATMAFKREHVESVRPIPKNWVHDGWIAFILSSVADLDFIERPSMKYRQHGGQQIGAAAIKRDWKKGLRQLARNNCDYYREDYDRFHVAWERLKRNGHGEGKSLDMLQDKLEHLSIRAQISEKNLPARLVCIGRELWNRRYFQYSSGFTSVAKDLLLGGGIDI